MTYHTIASKTRRYYQEKKEKKEGMDDKTVSILISLTLIQHHSIHPCSYREQGTLHTTPVDPEQQNQEQEVMEEDKIEEDKKEEDIEDSIDDLIHWSTTLDFDQ